ncbi:MAG: hybrid sensor histidine kinase/response regulator [Sinobacteraceae bacterium]|nr:hybrid sensor histidine kinase/response regulator [Nevskiaceae bacterium]
MTDAALVGRSIQIVLASLARQPAWSDLPVVLLCQTSPQTPAVSNVLKSFSNVTVLDRPTSVRTLVSTVQSALRGRLRQYQMRDQLEALRIAEENLRNADRRKDEFLAMLAHELRNPLAPIRNAGEVLTQMLPENSQIQTIAGIVKRQSSHLSRMVDDLLDVSRITQGRIELQQHPVDLSAVISQALESVEPLMREKRHSISVASGNTPVYVNGDHARLVQCIANVLTNSGKYTDPDGEIRIEMRADAGEVTISITDNGVGIPAELMPQIFDLFVQSNRSLDRSQGGLGIGLSVVRRLVEMHGGRVTAVSQGPEKGARFEVVLPTIEHPAQKAELQSEQTATRRRILVVDDNADAANSLAMILNLSGHVAVPVYGAAEALERAAAFDPEIVLLDIGLPGVDGYEVARQLKCRGSNARLVALTGYGQPEDIRRTRKAGFHGHLVKPVDLRQLLQDVGRP